MKVHAPASIFREYDIRGIAGKDLSKELAQAIGRAYARYIAQRPRAPGRPRPLVSVGRDCRLSGEEYANALCEGLLESGVDVVRLGVCATPVTYFSVHHLELDGAIMVTGSHNPANYNGFKICVGKDTLHGTQIQALRMIIEQAEAPRGPRGEASEYAIIPAYIDHLVKNARTGKKLKVVLDAGNGTAGNIAPELFKRIGANVTELYCELDGRFPNHHPDPTVPENLKDLIAKVRELGADFGAGFDGDSDRIGLVDENGRVIYGDELMVLFSRAVLKEKPGATIISEVKSSHRLYQDIAAKGGKPIMWKTGHSLIKSKMKETGAALAGEMSGHIFFADRYFGYDDAIYAALRAYEIVSNSGQKLSALLSDLSPVIATPEIRIDCEEELKFKLVDHAKALLSPGNKVTDIDGVRLDFADGWGLLRASNTQPVLVMRFEATSQNRLNEIKSLFESGLAKAAKEVGHPPIDTSGGSAGH